jgi:DNA-binding NtrC family response regulator
LQQTFQRVGGSEAISVDVRVIAATHRNLEAMMREGKFREDLFHRLNVVCLQLPPLRERREDIPVLVQHFLRKYAGDFGMESPAISSDAVAALRADSWPGNVRELENVTRRLLLAARGLSIDADAVRQTLAARNAEVARPASRSQPSRVICWRARRRASCRTLMPACSPRPSVKSSRKPSRWQRAIRRKPRAGLDCPDSPCAKS